MYSDMLPPVSGMQIGKTESGIKRISFAHTIHGQNRRLYEPVIRHTLGASPMEERVTLADDVVPFSEGAAKVDPLLDQGWRECLFGLGGSPFSFLLLVCIFFFFFFFFWILFFFVLVSVV